MFIKKIKAEENCTRTKEELAYMLDIATKKYGEFLTALGYDWENDANMVGTPNRVAKMWLHEIAKGNNQQAPNITTFKNVTSYDGMVFEGNIEVKSLCSHHTAPFFGKAYIAYIPGSDGKIIGLSKLNRIVDFFSRRPQVQENLTMQIAQYIDKILPENKGVAVVIEAKHTCVALRGVNQDSVMRTSKLTKGFLDNDRTRTEFYDFLKK